MPNLDHDPITTFRNNRDPCENVRTEAMAGEDIVSRRSRRAKWRFRLNIETAAGRETKAAIPVKEVGS